MAEKGVTDILVDLQAALERTTIFTIPPHVENWEDGFKSLDKARNQITRIKAALEHTPGASPVLVTDVALIHVMLGDFVRLRDNFRKEYPNGGSSHNWSQIRVAERQLDELQRRVADVKFRLRTGGYSSGNKSGPMEWRWFIVGGFMLLAAVGFAVWGFSLSTLAFHQRQILLWVLPLASGFAAGGFAGSFSVKARGWIPGLIIFATGGFAVWLISFYVLFPQERSEPLINSTGPSSLKQNSMPDSDSEPPYPSLEGKRPSPKVQEETKATVSPDSESNAPAIKGGSAEERTSPEGTLKRFNGRLDLDSYCRSQYGDSFRGNQGETPACMDGSLAHAVSFAAACFWQFGSEDYELQIDPALVLCDTSKRSDPPCQQGQRYCGRDTKYCCPVPSK